MHPGLWPSMQNPNLSPGQVPMEMAVELILVLLHHWLLFLHAGATPGHHGGVRLGCQTAALLQWKSTLRTSPPALASWRQGTSPFTSNWTGVTTTGNCEFAVCLKICRVLFLGHTAKSQYAVRRKRNTRRNKSTRQRLSSPCAPGLAHGEPYSLPCASGQHTAKSWTR